MRYETQIISIFKKINEAYKPGCVEYYEQFQPDRWQQAHDLLEQALLSKDPIRIKNHLNIFENTILSLIKAYEKIKRGNYERSLFDRDQYDHYVF